MKKRVLLNLIFNCLTWLVDHNSPLTQNTKPDYIAILMKKNQRERERVTKTFTIF